MIKGVYIHIPFCKSICSYCDFCKNYYNENVVKDYLDSLNNEIKKNYKGEVLDTLYIGGGTPSALSLDNLIKLFEILKVFKLNTDYEFTFECNYEDISKNMLQILKNGKVNRLSIGLQTFNKKYSKILNRNIKPTIMKNKIILAKKYFKNINVDLMYAFPDQTINELKEDIENFIKLNVNHISTYSLIIEKNTKLYIDGVKELSEDTQSDMYKLITLELEKNGYNHYEISNFSKTGYESKHNLTYWNGENYYGFGAGASGFINNIRYDNTKSIFSYIKRKRRVYEEMVDIHMDIKDYVMLALRKTTGLNIKEFEKKYEKSFNEFFNYKELIKEGLLEKNDYNIYIPKHLLFVSNEIIIKLLDTYMLKED